MVSVERGETVSYMRDNCGEYNGKKSIGKEVNGCVIPNGYVGTVETLRVNTEENRQSREL